MTQSEDQVDSEAQDIDVPDFSYVRLGYLPTGTKSDELTSHLVRRIPGHAELPLRWHYKSQAWFMEKYGHLGTVIWSKSCSSHLLLINGWHVIRLWHDKKYSSYVDLNEPIAAQVHTRLDVEAIPVKNAKKSKPLTKRCKITETDELDIIINAIAATYGAKQ